jgi:tetratricopeptide (TPR) repeat protein
MYSVDLTPKQLAYKQFAIGKDHYDNGQFKQSIPFFSLALDWNSNWKTCLKWYEIPPTYLIYRRAKAYHKIESWTEAIQDFTKLIDLDGSSANSWIARGVVYEALAKTDAYYNDKAFYDYSKVNKIKIMGLLILGDRVG